MKRKMQTLFPRNHTRHLCKTLWLLLCRQEDFQAVQIPSTELGCWPGEQHGGGRAENLPVVVEKIDALAERGRTQKKRMQRKLGILLCLEHLLATDCILSSKELFNYSRHFRPLYSQLRLFKYSLGHRYMALCFNCFSNICKEIVYLLSRCYASPPLLVPIGYY